MKTAKILFAAATLGAAFLVSTGAQAADIGNGNYKEPEPAPMVDAPMVDDVYGAGWMVRLRGLGVVPDDSSSNWTVNGIPAEIALGLPGSDIDITSTVVPELDITYFFTHHIAAELILGVTPHRVDAAGLLANLPVPFAVNNLGEIGSAWLLPPTLLLQYHFFLDNGVKPYVGVGVNYTVFFSPGSGPYFRDFSLDNNWGWALQAGVDIPVGGNWFINFDVKKVFLESSASVWLNPGVLAPTHPGAFITTDAQIDPWLIGVGFGYRFGAAPQPLK
jgi:outer membrane protein